MTITDFVEQLITIRPTRSEIISNSDSDQIDEELIASISEMFDYKVNDFVDEYNSTLLNCIYNTTVYEKGLANFYFVSTEGDDNFAYTDDDHYYYLEKSGIFLRYKNDYRLVCTSEEDFLYGMIFSFKANIDFAFRSKQNTVDDSINGLIKRVPNSNADYFVQRIREQYL